MKTHVWLSMCSVATLVTLAACKSSDSPQRDEQLFPELNAAKVSVSPLKASEEHEFLTYLKNGLYRTRSHQVYNYSFAQIDTLELASVDVAADGAVAESSPSGDADFSSTTTQEQGVDEADLIKYDGNVMYVVANEYYQYNALIDPIDTQATSTDAIDMVEPPTTAPHAKVRVLQKNTDNSLTALNDIILENSDTNYTNISSLYLAEQQLSVIYHQQNQSHVYDIWRPYAQTFNLALFDVQDPENSQQQANFQFDGYLISSRRIGNTLYLVSSFSPQINHVGFYSEDTEQKSAVYQQIEQLSENDLLPKVVDSSGESTLLVSPEDCYLPETATENDGFDSIVTLTAINLAEPSERQSVCVNNYVQGVYVSSQAAYLYGSDHSSESSFIHQFSLTDGQVSYAASGEVAGHFGWQQSNLRFSEYNGYLRTVATTSDWGSADRFDHHLYVLQANTDERQLELVSQLPNDSNPAEIGKPNEDVYAVRYFGDKAYVVTFERIDPLYVIDLSDELNPEITGELEVTGFSSYLHPIGENLLFAVGREVAVITDGFIEEASVSDSTSSSAASSASSDETAVSNTSPLPAEDAEGVKVVLFDVSDISNPIEVHKKVFEQGYSPAEYNYHALTHLRVSATEHRFSLPVSQQQSGYWTSDNRYVYVPNKEQLALFTVEMSDENGANASLNFNGSMVIEPENNNSYYGNYNDRSIIHGDVLYYLHGNYLWQSEWDGIDVVHGPY